MFSKPTFFVGYYSRRRRFSIGAKSQSRLQKNLLHWIYRYIYNNASEAVWRSGWGASQQFSTPEKKSRKMTVFWRAQISFFMSGLTREVVEPWAFPLLVREKIEKSRFWKWPFGSFWAPEIVSGWVLSCSTSREVSMFSGEFRTVFLDSDFRPE